MRNYLMPKLTKCPCGEVPAELHISPTISSKYAYAAPNCCGEWQIEFHTVKYDIDSEETQQAAIAAWNDAPRGDLL